MKHILNINNLDNDTVNTILNVAKEMKNNQESDYKILKNKIVATLFFEPSTRTHYSFQTAIYKLGGNVLNYNHNTSSTKKGETLQDTVKTMSLYCDYMVIRHPEKNYYDKIVDYTSVPIINAGDGNGEHPTQALLDLFTIQEYIKIDNFQIAFVGDLKNGRTIHSTLKLIDKLYSNITFHLVSVNNLELDNKFLYSIKNKFEIHENINDIIDKIDILYVTRIQSERELEKIKESIIIDDNLIEKSKEDLIILHPFPRNNELSLTLDNNKKSKYFQQMENGVFVRMALLFFLELD